MTNEKYSSLFKYHTAAAKKAKNIIRNLSDEDFKYLHDNYPRLLKNRSDIKQSNILDCIATDKNQKNWTEYKNFLKEEIFILEKKYFQWKKEAEIEDKKTKISAFKALPTPITYRDINDYYYPNRQPIKNCILQNLNFSIENYMLYEDSPLHGRLSWAKVYNSKFNNNSFVNFSFCNSHLEKVDLSGCMFSILPYEIVEGIPNYIKSSTRTDFQGSILIDCDLSNSILFDTYARGATFQNCNFSQSVLYGSNFCEADLRHCNFTDSNLINSDLRATLIDANLSGTNMLGADVHNIIGTIINKKTIFPDGTQICKIKNNINLINKGISTDQDAPVWWRCPYNHEWQETLRHFSINLNCPHCQHNISHYHRRVNIKFYIKSPLHILNQISDLLPPIESIKWKINDEPLKPR